MTRPITIVLPTRRLASLVSGIALVLGIAALRPALLGLAWAGGGLILALVIVDAALVARPARISVARRSVAVLSHDARNRIVFAVENANRRAAILCWDEVWPSTVAPARTEVAARVGPGEASEVSYMVTPTRRGGIVVPASPLRCVGPLGLLALQLSGAVSSGEYRVYPKLADLERYDLAARRSLRAEPGMQAVRALGPGTEIEGLREYGPDDEYRRIDWKATARRGTPIVRELRDERTQQVLALIDAGRLGAVPMGAARRIDHAINAALLLAHVASVRGDRVGMMVFDRHVRRFLPPARACHTSVTRLAQELYDVEPESVEADYDRAFSYLAAHERRRSLLVLFTDVLSPEASESVIQQLVNTRGRHLPVCVTIADPALEAAARTTINSPGDVYLVAAARELLDERQRAIGRMRNRGVYTLDVPPERATPAVVSQYLELKARRLL
jgi:uncharacterized protein (DUF58 family)